MTLQFKDKRTITPDNLTTLSAVHLEQLRLSGVAYGHDSTTASETLAQTFAAEADDRGNAEFWRVLDATSNAPIYDVWVFDVDTAMVFHANSTTDSGVSMMQNFFDIVAIATPELQTLCDDLQAAYDNAPAGEEHPDTPLDAYRDAVRNARKGA